eukprot:2444731-Amphidinium_carterae.1
MGGGSNCAQLPEIYAVVCVISMVDVHSVMQSVPTAAGCQNSTRSTGAAEARQEQKYTPNEWKNLSGAKRKPKVSAVEQHSESGWLERAYMVDKSHL